MIVGLTIAAVAEAFTLANANGVEPEKIREALFGGCSSNIRTTW